MLIDGKEIAAKVQDEIHSSIKQLNRPRPPCLAVIIVGDHPASQIYVKRKTAACESVGITSIRKSLDSSISQTELLKEIEKLNRDPNVDGILVQLPLPSHLSPQSVAQAVSPDKDVDGLHPLNMGRLLLGDTTGFQPCTPLGIHVLLTKYAIPTEGRNVVIAGRSNIVGKPMAVMLMQKAWGNATVTVVHSKTLHLAEICSQADILISAIGQPKFITREMVKEGAAVIDVGINRLSNNSSKNGYELVGDVDFEQVKDKCSYITPVPGGVGPMTIAMLLSNTVKAYSRYF